MENIRVKDRQTDRPTQMQGHIAKIGDIHLDTFTKRDVFVAIMMRPL